MTVAYRDYPLTGREFLFRRNAFSNTLITDCVQRVHFEIWGRQLKVFAANQE